MEQGPVLTILRPATRRERVAAYFASSSLSRAHGCRLSLYKSEQKISDRRTRLATDLFEAQKSGDRSMLIRRSIFRSCQFPKDEVDVTTPKVKMEKHFAKFIERLDKIPVESVARYDLETHAMELGMLPVSANVELDLGVSE